MGNYWSTDIQTNPLQIPNSHFDKYGLNEEKTVLLFKTQTSRMWRNGYTHRPTGAYEAKLVFVIPNAHGAVSQTQTFECSALHVYDDCYYFYDKNIGYIQANTEKTMNSLMDKYKIPMKMSKKDQPSPKPVLDQSQNSPSVNL
jgi:hypothetical protein